MKKWIERTNAKEKDAFHWKLKEFFLDLCGSLNCIKHSDSRRRLRDASDNPNTAQNGVEPPPALPPSERLLVAF